MKTSTITLLVGSSILIAFLATKDFLPNPTVLIGGDNQGAAGQNQSEAASPAAATEAEIRAEAERQRQQRENLRRGLNELNLQFEREQQEAAELCERRIREIIARAGRGLPGLAADAAAPMQGFRNAFHLVRLGTEDAFRSSTKRDDYVAEAMNPLTREMAETHAELMVAIEQFESGTRARINRHKAATLDLSQLYDVPIEELEIPDFSGIEQELSSLFGRLRNISIAVGIEAALIVPTIKVIKRVLAHVTSRAVGTATAAGVAAAVDGPLPIGDIIGATLAVGGGAWIAWDVRKAARQMEELPGTIEQPMSSQLERWQRDALRTVSQATQRSIQGCRATLP